QFAGGPPPLARGEPMPAFGPALRERTTPARAGRTRAAPAAGTASTDHPRSRGENAVPNLEPVPVRGPPPLARGELTAAAVAEEPPRTTPARAGRTPHGRLRGAYRADHPRSRGENGGAAGD